LVFSQFLLNRMHQKVPVRLLRDKNLILINRLYRERFLFLGDEVNAETSNQLSGLMLFLAIEEPSRDLFLYINSPGGLVISGVAIYQTMKLIPPDVHTIGMGIVASMASFILTGGTIPTRLAFPHARRQCVF
jgi:ATP-dependent Clp protease protease subunit